MSHNLNEGYIFTYKAKRVIKDKRMDSRFTDILNNDNTDNDDITDNNHHNMLIPGSIIPAVNSETTNNNQNKLIRFFDTKFKPYNNFEILSANLRGVKMYISDNNDANYRCGYKGFDSELRCKPALSLFGVKYEIGKTEKYSEQIELCSQGLHFCKNLINVFNYYPIFRIEHNSKYRKNSFIRTDNRFCKVVSPDDANIINEPMKSVTDKLTIIEEINLDHGPIVISAFSEKTVVSISDLLTHDFVDTWKSLIISNNAISVPMYRITGVVSQGISGTLSGILYVYLNNGKLCSPNKTKINKFGDPAIITAFYIMWVDDDQCISKYVNYNCWKDSNFDSNTIIESW